MAYGFALAASVFYAIGWVFQQREAALQPESPSLRVSLLFHLARRKLWLVGIGAMVVGNILQSVSFGEGTLGQVEPLLVASLLFALPIGAAWARERLSFMEWAAAIAVSAGVALFILVGNPAGASQVGDGDSWVLTGSATAALTSILVLAGIRARGVVTQAVLFSLAAGVLYGVADAMTKSLFAYISHHGILAAGTQWQPYALVAASMYGLLLSQDAYKDAPLPASLPPATIAEPIVGIAVGASALGEKLSITGLDPLWEGVALVLMTWGAYRLAHSPLIVAERRAEREAAEAEAKLKREREAARLVKD